MLRKKTNANGSRTSCCITGFIYFTAVAGRSLISNVHITDNVIYPDLFPLTVDIVWSIDPIFDCEFQKKKVNLPNWRTSTELDKGAYQVCTNEKFSNICIQTNALLYKQSNCTLHCKDILMYFTTTLFLHLKHPALIAYLCLNLIRLLLFVI